MDVCRRFQIYCVDVGCAGLEFIGSWMMAEEEEDEEEKEEARTGYQSSDVVDLV